MLLAPMASRQDGVGIHASFAELTVRIPFQPSAYPPCLVVPAGSDIACAAGSIDQGTSHQNLSSALWQQMSVPAQANGSHVTCTSPEWGSSYAAALEGSQSVAPVFIVLFDGDYELPILAHSNGSDSAGSPAYCNMRQTGVLFNFSPLWTQVLGLLKANPLLPLPA